MEFKITIDQDDANYHKRIIVDLSVISEEIVESTFLGEAGKPFGLLMIDLLRSMRKWN